MDSIRDVLLNQFNECEGTRRSFDNIFMFREFKNVLKKTHFW
jgi:hypothetical protein